METTSYQESIIRTQAKLKAVSDLLIAKGIATEEEFQKFYEAAIIDFKKRIEEEIK